jgi:hypothetical protein
MIYVSGVLSYLDLASMKSRDRLLKLILASLDYRRDEISRIILSKILTASTMVKLSCIIINTVINCNSHYSNSIRNHRIIDMGLTKGLCSTRRILIVSFR